MESSGEKPPAVRPGAGRFGWGPFTPRFLQFFNKVQWFVVWMSMFYLLEELSHSLVNIAITTLERRYGLTSSQTGFMVTAHHIGGLVVVVGVSYLGARGHKPRWLAIGTFIVGVGCFLFLLPQLLSDVFDYTDTGESNTGNTTGHVCEAHRERRSLLPTPTDSGIAPLQETGSSTTLYFAIFAIAEFILGVGDTPATTLAAPYIDENVSNKGQTSLYLGIYFAVGAVGAAIGYIVGGQSLAIYVDFNRVDMDTVTVEEGDPYWVGAWWIGFVALTIAFPTVALLIGGYPKVLPSAPAPKVLPDIEVKHLEKEPKEKEVQNGFAVSDDKTPPKNINFARQATARVGDLLKSVLVLFKNPTYVLLVIGGCAQALIAIGMLPFQAKILQEKFNISPTEAGVILSVISVVGQGGGEIIGGLIMRFWHLGPRGMLRFMAIFASVAAGFSACFFVSCQDLRIAGVNAKYGVAEHLPPTDGVWDACNVGCACDESFYQPVCGTDDVMYITPCHAGCTEEIDIEGELSYANCECIRRTLVDMGSLANATAESGRCEQDCQSSLIAFSALLLLQFMTLFATVPAASVLPLRCVREEHGALAVGVQWTFLRLLGVLPGPVMAGVVIDSACDFWGSEGSCLLYDRAALSWRIFLCWIIFQAFVVTMWAIGAQVYRPKWAGQTEADMELEVDPGDPVGQPATPDKKQPSQSNSFSSLPQPPESQTGTSPDGTSPPPYHVTSLRDKTSTDEHSLPSENSRDVTEDHPERLSREDTAEAQSERSSVSRNESGDVQSAHSVAEKIETTIF